MSATLTRAQEIGLEIKKIDTEVRAIHDEVDKRIAESKDGTGGPTKDEYEIIVAKNKAREALEVEFKRTEEFAKSQADAEQRQEWAAAEKDGLLHPGLLAQLAGSGRKTVGEQFALTKEIMEWQKGLPDGGNKAHASSPVISFKSLITGLSSTSAGALIVNDRTNIIDPGTAYRELTILDVIGRGFTNSDIVEYVREGAHTNSAAAVAEATATGDGTGALPESAMVLAVVQETVKNIGHWLPATNRALADAGQMRSLIDTYLRYGIMEELEDQIVAGAGSGENFTGLLNVSGTTSQAFSTDIVETTRKARTKVKTTGRARPTAYVMHPNDWEDFDLLQDNEARYYYGGPSAIGNPRLWGLPVVECEAMTEGTAMCAPFWMAMLWDREQASIEVSNSHSDFFIRDLNAIKATMRAAFGVIRPAAFVEIDLTA